jgi:hypothetical protein
MSTAPATPQTTTQQYLRQCTLLISNKAGQALDLSQLRIKFNVKMTGTSTPNTADIRVYNIEENQAYQIQKEFTKVVLQGGYQANFGVVFQGNIKQVLVGRESATDTYIDIIAGDGDLAYNFAIVNRTLAKGSLPTDQVNTASAAMTATGGTTLLAPTNMPQTQLPRAKVMYGAANKYMKQVGKNTKHSWSIQNGQIQFVPINGYLKGEAVVLTSKTGMVGTPQQTNIGVNIKCLMNPLIRVGGRVQINNKSIAGYKINLDVPGSPANIPAPLRADGMYYVWTIGHSGDTRGNDPWYTDLICIATSVSSNPLNSTLTSYSG